MFAVFSNHLLNTAIIGGRHNQHHCFIHKERGSERLRTLLKATQLTSGGNEVEPGQGSGKVHRLDL